MDLVLELKAGKARVRAQVIPFQDPSWIDVAGVGARFVVLFEDAEDVIRRSLADDAPPG